MPCISKYILVVSFIYINCNNDTGNGKKRYVRFDNKME